MRNDKVSPFTSFLYAEPSVIEGVGRLADFGGELNMYNTSASGTEADLRAIYADWHAVGDDLRAVMKARPASSEKRLSTHRKSRTFPR